MRGLYEGLTVGEKALLWVGLSAGLLALLAPLAGNIGPIGWAQVIVAGGTLALAVLALRQVNEMRAGREAQERPQVIVDADYSRYPFVSVVVRNIGNAPAKNITFEFSHPMVHSLSNVPPVDELPIFENGLPYLAPGAEFSSGWDSVNSLVNVLDQQGLQDGITVTAYYENLKGESEETEWNINPLRMAAVRFGEKGIEDLAKATEKIAKNSKEELDLRKKELKVLEEIRSIQRQVYRPMEELERSQTEKGAVDPRVRGRIIAAICAEWEITEGNMDSRAVWERLVREGNEPPANAMKGLLEDMEDKRLIRGRFALGGDEIPKHGNMTISGVAPELCETA